MRIPAIVLIFLFLPVLSDAQLLSDVRNVEGDKVLMTQETGYYHRLSKSGLKMLTWYKGDSVPLREITLYNDEPRSDMHHAYVFTDTTMSIIKWDSLSPEEENPERHLYIYDTKNRLSRIEIYQDPSDHRPNLITQDIRYDDEGRILSFIRLFPSYARHQAGDLFTTYLFHYNNNQVDSVTRTDSEGISHITYRYNYYSDGKIKSIIYDYHDPAVVLGGVRPWKRNVYNKYGYLYRYDRHGNWTRRLAITKRWRYLDAKRKIRYFEGD